MEEDNNLNVLTQILTALGGLDKEAQKRTIKAIITYLDISEISNHSNSREVNHHHESPKSSHSEVSFSQNRDISCKDFLRDKLPRTDVDRVACLAYYLTHYKGLQYFKTLDISALNTEAAQPKFSNAAVAVSNATRAGVIVAALKGSNQLSAAGEVFVQALPDREAALASIKNMRVKKRSKKTSPKASNLNKE